MGSIDWVALSGQGLEASGARSRCFCGELANLVILENRRY